MESRAHTEEVSKASLGSGSLLLVGLLNGGGLGSGGGGGGGNGRGGGELPAKRVDVMSILQINS